MAVAQVKMAINSPRHIAMLLEREEVMPRILKLIDEFIIKFPLAKFSTCLEDKLPGVSQHLPPRHLKSAVLVTKKLCEVGGREVRVLG